MILIRLLFNKLIICSLLFTICSISVQSQELSKELRYEHMAFEHEVYNLETIKSLKEKTTIFVLRQQDLVDSVLFEEAIKSVWSFSEIKVIGYYDLKHYDSDNYSFFILNGYNTELTLSSGGVINFPHAFLTLKYRGNSFCRIEMFTDRATMDKMIYHSFENTIEWLYQGSNLKNFTPAHLALYLKTVQESLVNNERQLLTLKSKNLYLIKKIDRNETLYVPDYVEFKNNKRNGTELEKHDIKKLFKNCPMKVKFINQDQLLELIMSDDDYYILDYVRSCTDKYVRLFSTKDGVLYQIYKPHSSNLKRKDIKNIFSLKLP